MKTQISSTILLLLSGASASGTADDSYGTDLAGCKLFAQTFANTCTNAGVWNSGNLAGVATTVQDCTGKDVGVCVGSTDTTNGKTCTWQRQLCVTCQTSGGKVEIKTQTNGLPNHCYSSPKTAPAALSVDYTTNWQPDITTNTASSPTTQKEVNDLICDIQKSSDSNIPTAAGYVKTGTTQINTMWGVAISGTMIANGLSAEGADPFYPAIYDGNSKLCTSVTECTEKVDSCLAHPQQQGVFHYHISSPCNSDATLFTSSKVTDVIQTVRTYKQKYRSVYGISKDGRAIYSIYYSGGMTYSGCQVDVCNGLKINGVYSYVATLFHPYFIGCYGMGNNPEYNQQCAMYGHRRDCYAKTGAMQVGVSLAAATVAVAAVLY